MTRPASLATALAAAGITTCGDNSCMFGRTGGMGTNGGCRCLPSRGEATPHDLAREAHRLARKLAHVARALGEDLDRSRAQVCRLVSGQAIEGDAICQHLDADVAARAALAGLTQAQVAAARAEIARLTTERDAATDDRDAIASAVDDLPIVEDDDIPGGRAGAIATIRNAASMIENMDAEIARLTAELTAARAVPADVEVELDSLRPYLTGGASLDYLKAAIARAIAEARQPATVGELLATAPTVEATAEEGARMARRIGDTYDLTIPVGRGRALAAMKLAEAIITRGPRILARDWNADRAQGGEVAP